ncbi:MAG: hypothetical protein GY862_07360 [Gammaproteobacteria bacterium]|nr:hypothetical protein [Gammaproteobacteria bacterium]
MMNKLRLLAKFKKSPSSEEQQRIKNRLHSFLKMIAPEVEIQKTDFGLGSWEIVITAGIIGGGWLLKKVADRFADRVMDRVEEKVIRKTELPDDTFIEEPLVTRVTSSKDEVFEQLKPLALQMREFAQEIGADELTIGEYITGRGRIMSASIIQDHVSIALYETDREGFELLTSLKKEKQ